MSSTVRIIYDSTLKKELDMHTLDISIPLEIEACALSPCGEYLCLSGKENIKWMIYVLKISES